MNTEHPDLRIDWQRLADRHDAAPHEDDDAWLEALERFDEDPSVRDEALAADPLLLFRDLPEPEADAAEVDAMREAVAGLRRAAALGVIDGADAPPVRHTSWRAAAAIGALALAAALLLPASPDGSHSSEQIATAPVGAVHAAGADAAHDASASSPEAPSVRSLAMPRLEAAPRARNDRNGRTGAALAAFDSLPLVEESETRPWIQIDDAALSLVVVDLESTHDFDV